MPAAEPYNGLTVILDSSALIKLPRAPYQSRTDFEMAVKLNRIRFSPVVELEILYGMSRSEEYRNRQDFFDQFPKADLRRTAGRRAVQSMGELAATRPGDQGFRRVKWADLLIAATAETYGFGVVHHDADFDRIGEVVDCKPMWFADRDESRWGVQNKP